MGASQAGAVLDALSQAALDLLPAPVFITAVPDSTILRLNRRAAEICGRGTHVPGRLCELLRGVAADGTPLPAEVDPIAVAIRNGSPVDSAEAVLETGGNQTAVSISVEPIRDRGDRIVAALILCHAIGRWKDEAKAAVALRWSEQRLALALAAGRLGAWEFDLEKRVLRSSAQCKFNHGLAADEDLQLETNLIPAIDDPHAERFRSTLDQAIATKGSFEIEVPHRWPNGSHHWLLVAGQVIEGSCMVGVSLDITARHQGEQALRDSEARFRTLVDNIAQLAWMADETGSIFWYNRRWFEYTGRTQEEMQGWGWQIVHHPDHVHAVVEKIRRCFETGQTWEDTFPLRAKDGTYRWFLSRAVPIRDERGAITRWFGTNTDVSEQRHAEEALLEADRRKDEFLTMLAHELRGPLAPILTAARILQLKGPADPELQKPRDTIIRQTMQLARLVDDLLDVGRITAGKFRLDRRRAELNAIVKQTVETCAPLIQHRRHTLNVVFSPKPIYLDVDAARIVQVACNLVSNAAKYMREGGRIDLAAGEEAGTGVIRVRDEGVGIADDMLDRVFERFVQVSSSRHRADGGLGIGLSLVKALVELHGGRVDARSAGIGKGSEFIVRLPLMTPDATDVETAQSG